MRDEKKTLWRFGVRAYYKETGLLAFETHHWKEDSAHTEYGIAVARLDIGKVEMYEIATGRILLSRE